MRVKKSDKKRWNLAGSRLLNFKQLSVSALIGSALLFGCSSGGNENDTVESQETGLAQQAPAAGEAVEDDGKGVGPVKDAGVGGSMDEALVAQGKALFEAKCTACHQLSDQKVVGPGLAGVTERRKPEWIMNMIINPDVMTKEDPTAKKLLAEHLTQMTNQNVNEQDARAILEFLRQNDKAVQ